MERDRCRCILKGGKKEKVFWRRKLVMAENREFLSIPEAAALMGISRIAVFKKVKKGQLAAIRIGRNWAIAAAALQSPASSPALRPAVASAPGKDGRPKSAAAPRPVPFYKPVPEKDSLDEMGWD